MPQSAVYSPGVIGVETSGAGEPLVLFHGVNTTRAIWQRVVPGLAVTGRLVVTPDLPGFGASSTVDNGFDLDRVADALACALETRVAAPFDLLGHSLGGAVALTLAHRRPELVRRLVLAAPAGFKPKPGFIAQLEGHLYAAAVDIRDVVAKPLVDTAVGRSVLFGSVVADPAALAPADARLMLETSRGGRRVREAIIAVETADLRPLLPALRPQLGLLWGERDTLVHFSGMETLRALAPEGVEVETVADAGHVVQIERPGLFVAAVGKLLGRLAEGSHRGTP